MMGTSGSGATSADALSPVVTMSAFSYGSFAADSNTPEPSTDSVSFSTSSVSFTSGMYTTYADSSYPTVGDQ